MRSVCVTWAALRLFDTSECDPTFGAGESDDIYLHFDLSRMCKNTSLTLMHDKFISICMYTSSVYASDCEDICGFMSGGYRNLKVPSLHW